VRIKRVFAQEQDMMVYIVRLPILLMFLLMLCNAQAWGKSCVRAEFSQGNVSSDRTSLQVIVPEEVKERWSAVRISVYDRKEQSGAVHTIPVGIRTRLGDTGLEVEIPYYLPCFMMKGCIVTTAEGRNDNPGIFLEAFYQKEKVFSGWLFGLYPDVHTSDESRYRFTLIEAVETVKKGLTKDPN